MSRKLLTYEKKDTWIDELCGLTKLLFFLCWSITSMMTYDTRVLAVMLVLSLVIFKVSKTRWDQVGTVFKFILFFLTINIIAIFLFAPDQGTKIYGTEHILLPIAGKYVFTAEQLFYELNIILKYFVIVPSVFIFVVTTNPSEFAASLNRVGVSYNIGYAVAIALRYIPDVQDDFHKIKNAQEARGIEMSEKASLIDRIKRTVSIIFPLIFTSMGRVDTISNAMELRGFGKHKKRTWYMGRKLKRNDYIVITVVILFMVAALCITYADGNRFYNPFV
jgi:energy-coupling factor transport system permease protein